MKPRTSSIATPVAHLVGPGKLKVINGRLAFSTGKGSPLRLDTAALRTLYCYGPVGISDLAFRMLFRHNVQVAWMTPAGHRCQGRLVRSDASSTALRIQQHQVFANLPTRTAIACDVVKHKIESQIQAARHYQRQGCHDAGHTLKKLLASAAHCQTGLNLDALRGVEGSASAAWFGLFGKLLTAPWQFTQRLRRPPPDPVNGLLSLGYTWLTTRTGARCEAAGLEIALAPSTITVRAGHLWPATWLSRCASPLWIAGWSRCAISNVLHPPISSPATTASACNRTCLAASWRIGKSTGRQEVTRVHAGQGYSTDGCHHSPALCPVA